MRRTLSILLVLTVALSCCLGSVGWAEQEELKIGVCAPLTGGIAQLGQMMKWGIDLAIENVNEAGGVQGRTLVAVYEDASNTTDGAVNAMNKLLANDEIVAIIGPHQSSQVFAVDTIVRESNMPVLVGGTNPEIPNLDNPNIFGCRTNDSISALAAATFIASQEGVSKIAIFNSSDDFGSGGASVAMEYFDKIGMEYIHEPHNLEDSDLSVSILKAMNNGCNAMFIWSQSDPIAILSRQMYEQGYSVPTVTNPTIVDTTTLNVVEYDWIDGWYCTSNFLSTNTDPLVVEFVTEFEDHYGMAPDNFAASYNSGAVALIDALQRAEDPTDRASVAKALLETSNVNTVVGVFEARPEVNQQLVWGINILRRNGEVAEFVEFVSAE